MATWDELTPAEKQRYIDAMYASDVMPPPRADAAFTPTVPTTGSSYQFGDVGRDAGNEALQAAYAQLAGAVNPQSRNLLDVATNYATGTAGGLLSGAIGLGQKAGGYAADVLGAGAEALGSDRWSRGGAAQALYGDMGAGADAAGVGPEARMLDAIGLLGAGAYATDAADLAARSTLANVRSIGEGDLAFLRGGGVPQSLGAAKLMGGGTADATKTGWTFRDMRKPDLSREDNKRIQSMFDRTAWQEVELPIGRMIATQPTVNADFAETLTSQDRLPTVVQKGNELFVRDGHHRLVKASEAGSTKAKVALINLDPRTEAPLLDYTKPAPWTPEDDALLAELLGSGLLGRTR